MSDVVSQTQEAVYQRMLERFCPGALMFFTAETGLGKTTGFQKGIIRMWDEVHESVQFLILVKTKKDADECWRRMEELRPGCAGVWTESHDAERKVPDDRFNPSVYFTKHEAVQKPALILTHNAGKAAEVGWEKGHRSD